MISVGITSTVRTRIDQRLLEKAARAALSGLSAEVSIVVVGDRRMRALNRDALGHDYVTDVLSFDYGDSPEGRQIELIVCAPHAAREARAHGVPFTQELARYVVHGCLHCAGHDDQDASQQQKMWAAQERMLKRLFGTAYVDPGL
ncbi:MAG: rRNA maturation RNase YbeY [Planctomycetota bacterium]|nr:rRNA maturation RNase YbeY [Planctomycetota bacterium]